MQTLSNELKGVISRRLEVAGSREVLAIASALCGDDAVESIMTVSPETARFDVYVGSGTVLDNTTGLMWSRSNIAAERMTWAEARDACEKLELGGYTDWRLPTIRELLTLVDYERHDPAIDTDVFQCDSAWYWTSTPAAPSPGDYAWGVFFHDGSADWSLRDGDGFVRAVRASQ